ncbi:MAG TPA: HEAT repeat domain-containing protein [Thermomicrobiales bacterium]
MSIEALVTRLIGQLADSDAEVQRQAGIAIRSIRDAQAIPALIAGLYAPQPYPRSDIVIALGQFNDPRIIEPLIFALTISPSTVWDNTGGSAAEFLGQLDDPRAVEPLIAKLDDPHIRPSVIRALRKLRDRRAVPALIQVLTIHRDPAAATALGNIGDVSAVSALLALVQPPIQQKAEVAERDSILRYYVVRALGKLGDSQALPTLLKLQAQETTPILKGKSVADMATIAIARIREGSRIKETQESNT